MKPLGGKAYGHIPHLPGSRLGPADSHCHVGQARICTEATRDRHDVVIVQVKLDGSCCAVAKVDGEIIPLGRAGYLASSSRYEQHRLFADWVCAREPLFQDLLRDGERFVGEWLAQAHGTRYALPHEPFAVFDLMKGSTRMRLSLLRDRVGDLLPMPTTVHIGGALDIDAAMSLVDEASRTQHGSIDPAEGAVWRLERNGNVDFLAKYVRRDKSDGCYLPEVTGQHAVWNWHPALERDAA